MVARPFPCTPLPRPDTAQATEVETVPERPLPRDPRLPALWDLRSTHLLGGQEIPFPDGLTEL